MRKRRKASRAPLVRCKHLIAAQDEGEEEHVQGTASVREKRGAPRRLDRILLTLVVLSTFLAWSLRVMLLNFDGLADLTVDGLRNEALRAAIFVGPVLLYLRYVEGAPALAFLEIRAPMKNAAWLLPLLGALFACWFLTLDRVIGDGRIGGAAATILLFTAFSPTTLVEEIHFRGFLLNKFRQATGFWRANLASSVLFGLIHVPGWTALGRFATPFVAVDFAGIVVLGLLLGWAMRKTGSLWSAYALHALHNLLVVSVFSP